MALDSVPPLVEQPKPAFTLDNLESKLSELYGKVVAVAQLQADNIKEVKDGATQVSLNASIKEACGIVQELLAETIKCKNNLQPIDVESNVSQEIVKALGEEKVQFHVCGVQLIENGKLQGTSLYSTIIKARKIKDTLNARFAELRVNHVAKILSYPVY